MSKEEQEAILSRLGAYANRGESETLTAAGMDFSKPVDMQEPGKEGDATKELMVFQSQCNECFQPGECKMCVASIPFFKEIIVMAFSCEYCGNKTTEIKQGGGISEKATKITFHFKSEQDLRRDIFKSDSCRFEIPELELCLEPGTLGSMYTTVEGMLDKTVTGMTEANPFGSGDSAIGRKWKAFIEKLKTYKEGHIPFTLILDDPLSNCFIYNPHAPNEDPQIEVTVYDRTPE